ncbi:MAG: hypothetical protein AAFU71_03620 [Cyanobacteria bacterium J06632_22]
MTLLSKFLWLLERVEVGGGYLTDLSGSTLLVVGGLYTLLLILGYSSTVAVLVAGLGMIAYCEGN